MQIVRKQLAETDIAPTNTRYVYATDSVQSTPDGGVTWVDNSASDPRNSDAARMPPLTTSNAQCDAAARIVGAFQTLLDGLYQSINAANFATDVVQVILLLFPPAGWIIDAILLVGDALITLGVASIQAAFTSEVWDGILCIIYSNIDANGQMSDAQLTEILSEIDSTYGGIIASTIDNLVRLFGTAGLSNAGVERTETGDCQPCAAWCYFEDFGLSDGGYASYVDPCFGTMTTYSSAWIAALDKYCASLNYYATTMGIHRTLPAGTYRTITARGHVVFGNDDAHGNGVTLTVNGVYAATAEVVGDEWMVRWEGSVTGTPAIVINVNAAFGIHRLAGGSADGMSVEYSGDGTNPFGTDNCP